MMKCNPDWVHIRCMFEGVAFDLIEPSVSAGIWSVCIVGISIALLFLIASLFSLGKSSAGLESIGVLGLTGLYAPSRNRLGLNRLIESRLMLHIRHYTRVRLFKLDKPDRRAPGVSQSSQSFSTRHENTITYRVLKISCSISLSVKSPQEDQSKTTGHVSDILGEILQHRLIGKNASKKRSKSQMNPVRTQMEIDELMGKVLKQLDEGTKFPGMSYEEGIDATINWLLNEDIVNPMDD